MSASTVDMRLDRLEAESAVHRRMAAYLRSCDTDKTPESISSHFTRNATWEGVGRNVEFGTAVGRAAIGEHFRPVPARQPFTLHYLTNGEVEVSGDRAFGRWVCFEPSIIRNGTLAVWIGLSYANDFALEDGVWLIDHLRCDTLFATPYDEGWLKTRFTPVTALDPADA
jgi:hypothetical protein